MPEEIRMRAALIGYGRMGKQIENALIEDGHTVALIIDVDSLGQFTRENFREVDVAIEFTTPRTAFDNVVRCLEWQVPVVCGTTGWNDSLPEAARICRELEGTFFHSSNFSVGVNILFALNEYLARIMDSFQEYDASLTEVHHIHKKDAPSGTAVTLAEGILSNIGAKTSWANHSTDDPSVLGIESVREGEVPGIHEITYRSAADRITITHEAYDRTGFARGVVMAARYALRHKGVLSMKDMLGF